MQHYFVRYQIKNRETKSFMYANYENGPYSDLLDDIKKEILREYGYGYNMNEMHVVDIIAFNPI